MENNIEKNVADNIKALRLQAGLKQSELGEKIAYSDKTVSKWENGLSEPDLETINKICSLFNVSANEFFGTTPAATETAASAAADGNAAQAVAEQKVIAGYCERCHKPVSAGEYKIISKQIAHYRHDGRRAPVALVTVLDGEAIVDHLLYVAAIFWQHQFLFLCVVF